jgi:hypothetical protein
MYNYIFPAGIGLFSSDAFNYIVEPAMHFGSYFIMYFLFFVVFLSLYGLFNKPYFPIDEKSLPYLFMIQSVFIFSALSSLLSYVFLSSKHVYDSITIPLLLENFLYITMILAFIMIIGYAYNRVYCTQSSQS